MNREHNITNINEYRGNMMPDQSAFNINEPNYSVEYVSDEMINSYVWEIGNNTPDLWSRIEAGFENEAKDVIRERKRKSARMWKTFGYVAAAVLITIIAIPVMKLGTGGEKSEEAIIMTESATEAYDTSYDEVTESVAMEAPAETDMTIVKGIQTDARQLVVKGEFIYDDDADIVKFSIKMVNANNYEELIIEIGDEITLSNPLYVKELDSLIINTEITLDSISIDNAGNITGRIIDLDLQGLDIEKDYIEE